MRRAALLVITGIVGLVTVWIYVGFGRVAPFVAIAVHPVVLLVILLALFRSWIGAVCLAVMTGIILEQYSVWPSATIIALVGSVAAAWILLRRWVAARSTASLVTTVGVATLAYYILFVLVAWLLHATNRSSISPVVSAFFLPVAFQIVIHPLITLFLWRQIRGGTFARADRQQNQPF